MKNVTKWIVAAMLVLVFAAGLSSCSKSSSKSTSSTSGSAAKKASGSSASRSQIDSFLDGYESFVVKVENAAKKDDLASLMEMSVGALEFAEKAENLEGTDDWTAADAQRYMELTTRYATAASQISGSMSSGDFGIGSTSESSSKKSAGNSSSRSQIDNFLDGYEKVVVKAEKAAKNNDMTSLMNLSAEAADFAEKAEDLEDMDDWSAADAKRYLELTNRYNAAISKISDSMDSGDFDMESFSADDIDLSSFSF